MHANYLMYSDLVIGYFDNYHLLMNFKIIGTFDL